MSKTINQILEEIRERLVALGYNPNIMLSLMHMPASMWQEHGFRPTPEMRQLLKEATAQRRSLNDVSTTCWNLCVVVRQYPLVPNGLYALTAQTACRKMLVLVKQFCNQHKKEEKS